MTASSTADRELVLTRLIDATPDKVYRAWTEPELLKQWFCPRPYQTIEAVFDVRPGGSSYLVMRSPEGQDMPSHGVYLEVVPNRRLVMTDAYRTAWEPSDKPFLTIDLSFEEEDGKTRYTARVYHWTAEDRATHEQMGFHTGWSIATDQLEEVLARL